MSGLDWTRCPVCGEPLSAVDGALRCPARHSFDVARQGYVNLLGRAAPANADTAAMLDARARFLASGHYDPIADAVAGAARGERLAEVGAGTGFYLARVLDAHPEAEGLATDVSVAAAGLPGTVSEHALTAVTVAAAATRVAQVRMTPT